MLTGRGSDQFWNFEEELKPSASGTFAPELRQPQVRSSQMRVLFAEAEREGEAIDRGCGILAHLRTRKCEAAHADAKLVQASETRTC